MISIENLTEKFGEITAVAKNLLPVLRNRRSIVKRRAMLNLNTKTSFSLFLALILVLLVIMVTGCAEPVATDVNTVKAKTVHVNDIDISYKEMGKGYPLIMIMGFSGTMEMWSPVMLKELAGNNRVIILDNRGIGGTTASDKKFTIELFAADMSGFLDALNIKSANILGWSMGGYIAQELALTYPDKVNRLILYGADCGGKEQILPSQEVTAMMMGTSETDQEKEEKVRSLLFPQSWREMNPDPQKYMQNITESASSQAIEGQITAMEDWSGSYSRLSNISQNTLLITGTADIVTPPQNSLMMMEKIPGAWLVQYPGGGHGVMFQNPEEMAQVIKVFLSERK